MLRTATLLRQIPPMFAIIEDGNRQYRVAPGETLSVDYRADAKKGDTLTFQRVLLANGGAASAVGRPLIDGASVEAEVVIPQEKGPKIEVQKLRRRKNSRRHTGHRQKYTAVRVTAINVPGLEVVEEEPPQAEEPEAAEPPSTTATAQQAEAAEPAATAESEHADDSADAPTG